MGSETNKTGRRRCAVWKIAKNEYIRWICNPRMIVFFGMLIFIQSYVVEEMLAHSEKMGMSIGIFEIFIAVANSTELCILIPAVYLLLNGDFPRRDGNTLLYVYRAGRYEWLLGQMLMSVLSILTYLGAVLAFCIFSGIRHCYIENQWSDVVTKYTTIFPDDKTTTVTDLITGRLYNNFTPFQAFLYSISLLFCMLFFMSMLKLFFFLFGKATTGVAVGGCLIVFGWIFSLLDLKIKWIFPLSHAVEWQHCDEIFRTMTVSMQQSYLYFGILGMIFFFVSILLVEHFNFGYIEQR